MYRFVLGVLCLLFCITGASAQPRLDDTIAPAIDPVDVPDDVEIFLLIGAGNESLQEKAGLTDMLMLVAVNRATNTASMLHIPRDYWVNIPGFGMHKINQAFYFGETHEVEGGGIELLKQTILYNFGLPVDHYAAIDFNGFLSVIDQLGGIRIAVDCIIQDWKLKERELDKRVADNYELVTLPIGVHTLDADTALWYIRSRVTSSDLDRGRRTQDVLRAIWRKVRSEDMLAALPALWDAMSRYLYTDLTLGDLLGYVPFALNIDADRVEQYRFRMGTHIKNALGPAPDYQSVIAPADLAAIHELVVHVSQPAYRGHQQRRSQRYGDGCRRPALAGRIRTVHRHRANPLPRLHRHLRLHRTAFMRLFRVTPEGVIVQPDPNRTVDYKIYVGNTYSVWACTRNVIQPKWPPDPTPTP
ncbi:LytR family transcriptional regulator [Anaerolineae bacterium CFX4]|nr:LytR family transcriptional regulator [Anaerolineae bacterium CFX4]